MRQQRRQTEYIPRAVYCKGTTGVPVIAQGYKHFYVVLVEAAGCEAAVNRGGTAKIRPLSRLGWRAFYSPPAEPGPGGGIFEDRPSETTKA